MTYPEIMAQWKSENRWLWPYMLLPMPLLVAFLAFFSWGLLSGILALVGVIASWWACCHLYGNHTDRLIELSHMADDVKMERLVEDLGQHAENMPLMAVPTSQELGNVRYPSRIQITIQGTGHMTVYDWEKRRFGRYLLPFLPYSIDKVVQRAKLNAIDCA